LTETQHRHHTLSSVQQRRVDLAAAILLGLAGVAAAWGGYQASIWSGIQATEFTRAQALLVQSSQESAAGDAERAIDLMTFSSWVDAYARDDERLMAFYRERFRPEFAVAFEAWLATTPVVSPEAPPTPFAMTEYQRARIAAAEDLEGRAQEAFERGRNANHVGDRHVLSVVLFATVLLLAGIAQHSHMVGVQVGLLALAFVIFSFAVYGMAILPNA
jgi:hypothetical protein